MTYKSLFLRHPIVSEVDIVAADLADTIPAYFKINKGKSDALINFDTISIKILTDGIDGVTKSREYSHGELAEHPSFWFAKNVIEKRHFEL